MKHPTRILLALCPLTASLALGCGSDAPDADGAPVDVEQEAKPQLSQVELTRMAIVSDDEPSLLHPLRVEVEMDVAGDAFDSDVLVGLRSPEAGVGCVLGALEAKKDEAGASQLAAQGEFFPNGDCAELIDADDVELFAAFDPWHATDYARQGETVEHVETLYQVALTSVLSTERCNDCEVATSVSDSPGLDAQLREVSLSNSVAVLKTEPADTPDFAVASGVRVAGLIKGVGPLEGETALIHGIRPRGSGDDFAPLVERRNEDGTETYRDRTVLDVRGQSAFSKASSVYFGDDVRERMLEGDWAEANEFEFQTCVAPTYAQAVFDGETGPRDNDCAVLEVIVARENAGPHRMPSGAEAHDAIDGFAQEGAPMLSGTNKARTAEVWSIDWLTTNEFAGSNYTNGVDFTTWIDLNAADGPTTTYGGRPVTGAATWFEAGARSNATVFNNVVSLLDASVTAIGYNTGAGSIDARIQALGFDILNVDDAGANGAELTLEQILQAAGASTTTTWSAEYPLVGYSFDDGCGTVSAGIFLKGEIGVDNQETKISVSGGAEGMTVSGTIAPTAAILAESKAEAAYDQFVSIGVSLTMAIDILRITLPFTSSATVLVGEPSTLTLNQGADLVLSTLAGTIDFAFNYEYGCFLTGSYYGVPYVYWGTCSGEHAHNLASWDGISNTWNLFSVTDTFTFGTVPSKPLAEVAFIYDEASHPWYWEMQNGDVKPSTWNSVPEEGAGYSVVAAGDLDGNGYDDIVMRHSNGQVRYIPVDNGTYGTPVNVGTPWSDWTVDAVGDFDADNVDEIVWRHTWGDIFISNMSGGLYAGGYTLTNIGFEWQISTAGDINVDGTDDIILRHSNGMVHYWDMLNGQIMGGGGHDIMAVGLDWQIRGMGDLDGNGQDDVIWQYVPTGQPHYWPMVDGVPQPGVNFAIPVAGLELLAIGNFEG